MRGQAMGHFNNNEGPTSSKRGLTLHTQNFTHTLWLFSFKTGSVREKFS